MLQMTSTSPAPKHTSPAPKVLQKIFVTVCMNEMTSQGVKHGYASNLLVINNYNNNSQSLLSISYEARISECAFERESHWQVKGP